MANSYVQLPADGPGKKLDTEQLSVGANTVERERNQIAGVNADDIAVVTSSDPSASDHGVVVREARVINPVRDALTASALAAGASATLDGTTIANGATGKLMSVHVSSSVAAKWVISARDGAIVTTIAVLFTGGLAGRAQDIYRSPAKDCDVLAGAGVDENFRVVVTNLDDSNTADQYATIHWDEVI